MKGTEMAPKNVGTDGKENISASCLNSNSDTILTAKNGGQELSELTGSCCDWPSCMNGYSPTVNGCSSKLIKQWPLQLKLAPIQADFFEDAKLLLAADCTAYSYALFHQEFVHGRVVLIGCPKLDDADYSQKLAEILQKNKIRSLMIVRMDVPCCAGLEQAAIEALNSSGKFIPWQVVKISAEGKAFC
ncbi:MAG: hypothetical protein ACI38Q_03790 [Candidatus Bruticola sp.]